MHISEAKEFIAAALDNDQIDFDDNGVCKLQADSDIAKFIIFAPPTLRMFCIPFSTSECSEIDDKVSLLESLLAINYESDIGSRQAFKMGFHQELGLPIVVADMDTDSMQAETLRATSDELHSIANIVRETVMGDGFVEEENEVLDIMEDDLPAFNGNSLWP